MNNARNKKSRERKMRIARRKAILRAITKMSIATAGVAAFIMLSKSGALLEVAPDYVVPEKAISGGIVNINGIDYERYHYEGRYYLLDLSTGAWIPQ